MTTYALYLTELSADSLLARLLLNHCEKVTFSATLAQATAIFSNSLNPTRTEPLYNLIVADVPVGGINLAEYVLGRIRPSAYFRPSLSAISVVLYDPVGDVVSARRALQAGVDEYLLDSDLTPTHIAALLAQLQSRYEQGVVQDKLLDAAYQASVFDDGILDDSVPQDNARNARLSSVEAAIVHCLTTQRGEPMSARSIVHAVMGRDVDEDRAASLIRPHISRLRSKVEPLPQMPQRLLTVRGKGYMLVDG
jgi:DNA-binding response OmpR family regulator